jgi:hypothetical protein
LKFAADSSSLANANEDFGNFYAKKLEDIIKKGFLLLPHALQLFKCGESSQKMSKPVVLIPV